MNSSKNLAKYFLIFFLFLRSSFAETGRNTSPNLIGYFNFGTASPHFKAENIPGNLLTHIIYSFLQVSDSGECQVPTTDKLDSDGEPSILKQFGKLKMIYPSLTPMVGVGGWGGSGKFSDVASNEANRKTFVKSCIKILTKYHLEGIDIDWEYPVTGGLPTDSKRPEDVQNFVLLLSEFRKALDQIPGPKKVLSAAVAAYRNQQSHLDVLGMVQYTDWLGIMTYDYYGASSKTTGHNAGLHMNHSDPRANEGGDAKAAVDLYLKLGASPNQLAMGVPFYGKAWTKVPNTNRGLYQTFKQVPKTRLGDGALNYQEIKDDYLSQSSRYFDSEAKVPWLYNSSTQTMVTYEDPESLDAKAKFVKKAGLNGILFWELNHDDRDHELLKTLSRLFNINSEKN